MDTFDPDAFLKGSAPATPAAPAFDPDAFLSGAREKELRTQYGKEIMGRGEPGYGERFIDAATMGTSRPLSGLVRGVSGVLDPNSTFGERYRAGVGAAEDYFKKGEENTPGALGVATDVAGSLAAPPVGKLYTGARNLLKAGKTAVTGAPVVAQGGRELLGKVIAQGTTTGAIEGAARNAKDVESATEGAVTGGAIGGATSAAVGAAAKAVPDVRDSGVLCGAVESGMAHISGHDRSQLLLLPEAVDDYVAADNPVRFIEAFVDGLDLAALGFTGTVPKATGRPGYAPADLLKLYIYGYLNRVRSSRRLEAETHRNIEVIWLLRHLKPDFKTIADFRRDNRKAFRPVFRQFVLLCKQLDLFGRELLAVDGTRIKAVNNKDRNFTRASLAEFIRLADKKLDDYLQRLDQSDATEQTAGGARVANLAEKIAAVRERRERCKAMLAELDQTGESQISLTDPDSRAMAAHTHVAVGYNVQVAVDTKHKLIVEQQVTNQVLDMGLLTETAEPAKEILGVETIDVVADMGYFKIEDIEACEKAHMVPYVPRPQRGPSVRKGLFRKDEFKYDAETDSMICPAGQRLHPYTSSLLRGLKKINYANRAACRDCPLRPRCTGNQFRSVSRLENEAVLDRMAARLALRPGILGQRREAVEHPFGTIKQWMYQGAFLMRGLEKVRAEFSLTALAYNIRRVLNLVAFDKLMVAMKAAPG